MTAASISGSVTVVIPTRNAYVLLTEALHSLQEQPSVARTIVVDNASDDQTPTRLEQDFPGVTLVALGENVGFGAAVNAGLSHVRTPFVFVMNNDVRIEGKALGHLARALDADPAAGAVAPLIVSATDATRIDSAGIALTRHFFPMDLLHGEVTFRVSQTRRIFGPCAGAALYRVAAIAELGGFCSDFFMYLEDVDLAWRLQAGGWRTWLVPDARVTHLGSATAGRGSRLKNYYMGRNRWLLWSRNVSRGDLMRRLPQVLATELVVASAQVLRDRNLGGIVGRVHGLRMWKRAAAVERSRPWDPSFAPMRRDVARRFVRRFLWQQ